MVIFHQSQMCGSLKVDIWLQNTHCPRCVVPKKTLSQMCCSKNANVPDVSLNDFKKVTVPDVWFKNTHCPRCVVPKKTLSQMCCSKNANVPDVSLNDFQKGNCPRCVVQKHSLSQMCRSKKRMPAFTERKTKKDEHHSPQQLALV